MSSRRLEKNSKSKIFLSVNYSDEITRPVRNIFTENTAVLSANSLDDSFHIAIRPVATFVQFLFLMPVCGITSRNVEKLKFRWLSLRVLITLLYICYGALITAVYFKSIYEPGIDAKNFVGLVFFSYTTVCAIIFLQIATNWPQLSRVWLSTETKFLQPPYTYYKLKLSTKVRIMAIVIIALAFFEHALYLANSAYNHLRFYTENNVTFESPLSYFLENQIGFLFKEVKFSLSLGFFVELMNISFTFGWNYMELFVMMISMGLITRFQQVNQRMEKFRGKIVSESLWISVRCDYMSICELVERVDHDLRYLILLSNLNNLYFICFQLLNIFNKLPYTINHIYFWYSLIYLFGRTLVSQFMAASINDSSKYPINVIKSIPCEGWCIEMQRFIDDVKAQHVALSGMRFFYLTRKSILTMLATIVTYELVLMQFDNTQEDQCP